MYASSYKSFVYNLYKELQALAYLPFVLFNAIVNKFWVNSSKWLLPNHNNLNVAANVTEIVAEVCSLF